MSSRRLQTVVTKLYVQHRAAMNYISKRDRNSTVTGLSYKPGELTADMLKADLPYGFRQDSGFNKFTTWVYCLDKDKLENSGAAALPAVCTSGCRRRAGKAERKAIQDLGTGGNCCAGVFDGGLSGDLRLRSVQVAGRAFRKTGRHFAGGDEDHHRFYPRYGVCH